MKEKTEKGQYVNDLSDHPSFERIRSEILGIVDQRAREAQDALRGLLTFSGVLYSGAVAVSAGLIGSEIEGGVSYMSIASFISFCAALAFFAITYQQYSQLMAARNYHYADTAQKFFLRQATFQEVLEAGRSGADTSLFRRIFWVPFSLSFVGIFLGVAAIAGVGSNLPPMS